MMHGGRMGRGGPRPAPNGGNRTPGPRMGHRPHPPRPTRSSFHFHHRPPRFHRTGCLLPIIGVVILGALAAWLMGWI